MSNANFDPQQGLDTGALLRNVRQQQLKTEFNKGIEASGATHVGSRVGPDKYTMDVSEQFPELTKSFTTWLNAQAKAPDYSMVGIYYQFNNPERVIQEIKDGGLAEDQVSVRFCLKGYQDDGNNRRIVLQVAKKNDTSFPVLERDVVVLQGSTFDQGYVQPHGIGVPSTIERAKDIVPNVHLSKSEYTILRDFARQGCFTQYS